MVIHVRQKSFVADDCRSLPDVVTKWRKLRGRRIYRERGGADADRARFAVAGDPQGRHAAAVSPLRDRRPGERIGARARLFGRTDRVPAGSHARITGLRGVGPARRRDRKAGLERRIASPPDIDGRLPASAGSCAGDHVEGHARRPLPAAEQADWGVRGSSAGHDDTHAPKRGGGRSAGWPTAWRKTWRSCG